ncbi:unnamed protein product [Gongylonema pulchrum]|uniref:Uncharacterized protein n=1 Tax=Gongylonema pulchrum TaxID=637853 RepID=A0A183DIP7_9BILA|nr:unnamed protein product [Gongylonema pulchrum]
MKGAICNKTCEHLDPCYNVPMPPEDPRMQGTKKPEIPCIEVERSSATCGSGQTGPIYRQLTYREQMNIVGFSIQRKTVELWKATIASLMQLRCGIINLEL